MVGGGAESGLSDISFQYSTGKPMVISKIDYIVFDGEKISFAEDTKQ